MRGTRLVRDRGGSIIGIVLVVGCSFDPPSQAGAMATSPAGEDSTGTTATSGGEGGSTGGTPASTGSDDATSSASSAGDDGAGDWWDPAFGARRHVTLGTPAGGSLEDFPLLLRLDLASGEYVGISADGRDLRVVDEDGETLLPHEIESFDAGGQAVVWVGIPTLDPDEDGVWLYWGDPTAAAAEQPADVWAGGYAAVWHMNADPLGAAPQVRDSAGSHHGTLQGDMPAEAAVEGRIGAGLRFDGIDDVADMGDVGGDLWQAITLEAWIRPLGERARIVCKATGVQEAEHTYCMSIPNGALQARLETDGQGGSNASHDDLATIELDAWRHVAVTWSSAKGMVRAFVDGEEVDARGQGGATIADSDQGVAIANVNLVDDRYTDGIFDEVRISSVARRPLWLRAQYRTMTGSLATFDPVQTLP